MYTVCNYSHRNLHRNQLERSSLFLRLYQREAADSLDTNMSIPTLCRIRQQGFGIGLQCTCCHLLIMDMVSCNCYMINSLRLPLLNTGGVL